MTCRLPSSRPWTGPSIVCARYKALWFGKVPYPSFSADMFVVSCKYVFVCTVPTWVRNRRAHVCLCERFNLLLTCCAPSVKEPESKCWWKTTKTSFCLSILLKDAVSTPVTFASAPDQHHITINLQRSEQMMEHIRQHGKTYTIAEPKNTPVGFLVLPATQYSRERVWMHRSKRRMFWRPVGTFPVSVDCSERPAEPPLRSLKNNTSRSNDCIIVPMLNEDKWQRFTRFFIVGKLV